MRFSKLMLTLTVALVVALSLAVTAQAETQVSTVQYTESPFATSVTNVSVSVSNGHGKLMVLQDVHDSVEKHSSRCHWVKEAWNSGENANGTLWWFKDTNMYVCPSKSSPTGWAKEAGGMTGRHCGNPVRLIGTPPHNVVSRKKIKLVAHLTVTATVHVIATASLSGTATATCSIPPFVSASSSVSAIGTASASAAAA
jgi:hypothetical protein